MANSNVRFYKLATLPNFEAKHKGIFVHVTSNLTRTLNEEGTYNYIWGKLNSGDIQKIVIQQIENRPVLVPEWMNLRRIDTVESGLWFGGENGWELLSNDTTSGAIDAAINAKIQELHVDGYAQATISGSTLTISGIKEDNGKIAKDTNNNLVIAIDGTYNESTNKIATESTVTTAIGALDSEGTIQAVTTAQATDNNANTVLTFKGVQETNGVIAQGTGTDTFTVGNANLKIQIGSAEATNVFSANAQSDSTIKLDGLVFKKNDNNEISVITPTAVSSSNKLVTQQDIANLNGAMHYKTTIANAGAWPETVKAGDVYIATGENFEYNGQVIESGDMIVFNSESITDFIVVQSNITSGIKSGQIAKNVGDLTPNNMVIATSEGIKTIGISETNLTDTNDNHRHLSIGPNGPADGDFHHDVTITDALKVIGKDFSNSINISSPNRSINIINKNVATGIGVMVDLVWNTRLD